MEIFLVVVLGVIAIVFLFRGGLRIAARQAQDQAAKQQENLDYRTHSTQNVENEESTFDLKKYYAKNQTQIDSFSSHFDLNSVNGIRAISAADAKRYTKAAAGVPSLPEQILFKAATEHKKNGNMELAIECLRKVNELLPTSSCLYQRSDYERLVNYLVDAEQFDEARKVHANLDTLYGAIPKIQEEHDRSEYYWLKEHIKKIAPKSFGGYRRMKSQKTEKYKEIVAAVKDSGNILSRVNFWASTPIFNRSTPVTEEIAVPKKSEISLSGEDEAPWNISISFGATTSKMLDRAIYLAKSAPRYEESEFNGQKMYQAYYASTPSEYLAFVKLYEIAGKWKSATVMINGQFVDRKIVGELNYCYGDYCRNGRTEFCFGASEYTENPFGCHRLQISASNNPWFTFSKKTGEGYIVDKKSIKNRIDEYSTAYRLCPKFSYNDIIARLEALPDFISDQEMQKLNPFNAFALQPPGDEIQLQGTTVH